jgi:hypothetical protein
LLSELTRALLLSLALFYLTFGEFSVTKLHRELIAVFATEPRTPHFFVAPDETPVTFSAKNTGFFLKLVVL